MSDLHKFLGYLKKNHLEEAAREMLLESRELNLPILKKYDGISDERLVTQIIKNIEDLADSIDDYSYAKEIAASVTKIEAGEVGGVSKEVLHPDDLVPALFVHRKVYRKFLPSYTQDMKVALNIMSDLETYHFNIQNRAHEILFSAEKEKELELKSSNKFLNALLENIPNMIFVKDAKNLKFVRLNKAGEDILGFSKTDLIGKSDYDFFPKEQAEFFIAKDRDVLMEGNILDIPEEPIQTKKLGERWLHTMKIPIPGENGKPGYLLGISEDITERKKQADAIRELNHELEAFSYSVSHDLRAPLRAINGYAQILEEDHAGGLTDDVRKLLLIIKQNAVKMGKLIDELLVFSRLGRKELVKSDVNMNELIDGVRKELSKAFPHRAEIHIADLHPAKADYTLLHQVMFHLLSNAVKYSSKKERAQVNITSRACPGEVVYSIKDNGVGFNMQYVGKLFGVFQRLHRADEFDGVGVGLAIVKRIVTRHGGKAWAEGTLDEGAVFSFSIPSEN